MQIVVNLDAKRNLNSQQLWNLYQNSWKRFQDVPTDSNQQAAELLAKQWREAYQNELSGGANAGA